MQLLTIIIIAVGLAMDAFAVSIVSGSVYKQLKIKHAFRIAIFFGGFQAIMPLIGSLAGISIKEYIADFDHWIAFALLSAVGVKMIYESFKITKAEENFNPENIMVLLTLSVATSIDALVVGITLSILQVSITIAVIIIGLVTFALSYLGVLIGKKFGHFFENKIEAVGGLVLIGLGVKILFEHLAF
ncbi:MAG: manganese efflux pump MntP family protein [Phycisphaerae bacterium]|nr:manganese efflux pump MntP family protein [Phycisphaerae bacterium]MDD5380746.1 manganese efflux pump MntP family protein [Phycisphaerae bacterium]